MTDDAAVRTHLANLDAEVTRLRREAATSRVAYARALSRATRLAQLVSAVGQLTDPTEILERAACEIAEQFFADIAVFLVPAWDGAPGGELRVGAHWGLAAGQLPSIAGEVPAEVKRLTTALPLIAGPIEELEIPQWLRPSGPRHVAWGRLAARREELGYLILARRADEPFEPADVQELELVVGRVALAVDNGRLYVRTQEQLRRLRRLHEVTTALAATLDLDLVVQSIARTMVDEVPVDGAAVYLARERGLELTGRAGGTGDVPLWMTTPVELSRPDVRLLPLDVGGPAPGALLLTGAPPEGSEAYSFLLHLADLSSLVIEKSLLFQRIRLQAESDTLTGLPNRAVFMDRLQAALTWCRTTGTDLGVIFVDLDDFKSVNDTHGHTVGDQLLIAVAGRITGAVRPTDTVARLGGDEFVVLRQHVVGPHTAEAMAQRIRSAIAAPYQLGETRIVTRGSVGFGLASRSGYHAVALMRDADAAMYADKHGGGPLSLAQP